jgi:hypothetical protein
MKYAVRVNRKISYIKSYRTLKKSVGNPNIIMKYILKLANLKKGDEEKPNI